MQPPSSKPTQHMHTEPTEAREVVKNIWKFTIPIPFPLRDVNMYALIGRDGWALIDAGIGMPNSRAALQAGLQQAGLRIEHLQAIVLTHHHPDHIGLSAELQEQSGARVYMHPIDEKALQIIWSGIMPQRFSNVSHFFSRHGLPDTVLWYTQVAPQVMHDMIRVPPHETFTMLEDGQEIELADERYQVIWVPGHSDGLISLFRPRDGVFLSSDHVLPRITPNIGLYAETDRPDPLNDYLNSLQKVNTLPATIVLPGHREPFNDLQGRIAEIVEHHEQRLAEILSLLTAQPAHAYQLTEQLFGARLKNDEARRMALAEVLAHLEYLRLQGRVEQRRNTDGILLYVVTEHA
jgi:glyoxylase-like metal-dependent hydrolase (beta-lactamase superfamily II)